MSMFAPLVKLPSFIQPELFEIAGDLLNRFLADNCLSRASAYATDGRTPSTFVNRFSIALWRSDIISARRSP